MEHKYVVAVGSLSLVLVVVILHTTTPAQVGPFGILAFFVCVYLVTTAVLYAGIFGLKTMLLRLHPSRFEKSSRIKLYYYASVAGLVPVILLGIQSIGSVRAWDIALLIVFVGLSWFYVHKRF